MLHHIPSLFDSSRAPQLHSCAEEMVSANAIRVNNRELSRCILLVAFDVLDVIKSAFCVSSASVKSVSHSIPQMPSVSYWADLARIHIFTNQTHCVLCC